LLLCLALGNHSHCLSLQTDTGGYRRPKRLVTPLRLPLPQRSRQFFPRREITKRPRIP
jgi:hypothetical protein